METRSKTGAVTQKRDREDEEEQHSSSHEHHDEDETETKRPKTPAAKKQKKQLYEFDLETDGEVVNAAIQEYGLNYTSIHEKYFKDKCSLNRLKTFINSEEMLDIKTDAADGTSESPYFF